MIKNTFLLLVCTMSFFACKEKKNNTASSEKTGETTETETVQDASFAFIGTYTRKEGHVDGQAEGIYLLRKKDKNGSLEIKSTAGEAINPSFLAISPDKKNLYAVSEVARKGETGSVHVFTIDDNHNLTPVQNLPTDAGAPCYVITDSEGKYVFVANYVGGVVKMYKRGENGLLTPADKIQLKGSGADPARQEESHPHSVVVSPDDRFVFVPDLGSDKIWNFKIDTKNDRLVPNDQAFIPTSPGAGPRHFAFHPNGKYAYVINELDNTVNAFSYDAQKGELTEIQSVTTLPENFEGNNKTADIHIHPNGKFLYGSNRGHNSIVVYGIDPNSGKLSPVEHVSTEGDFPRNFAIHPSGNYLYAANQNSDNIVWFNIDTNTGRLSSQGELEVKTPVCIIFYP